jgi:hypothetical protein
MKKHYKEIVRVSEINTGKTLGNINSDGKIVNVLDGMYYAGAQLGSLVTLAPAYYCEDNCYYHSKEVLSAMMTLTETMKSMQREDGTFDLPISNFHSAPDTGFIIHNTYRIYNIMENRAKSPLELKLKDDIYKIIEIAAKGLHDGGFHTPNHRWVESAGLAMAYNVTKEEYLKEMVLKYLNEGMDIDENGEWTERSPGIYNAVSDNAVMILAEQMELPELYEAVMKNMDLMFHYLDPNGAVFTQNSVRVDKGEGLPGKAFYPTNYYHIYLKMALLFKNGKYAKFADLIFESALRNGRGLPNVLWLYMLHNELKDFEIEFEEIPDQYEVFYQPSKIVRARNKNVGVTILGDSSNFLFVSNNNMRCYVRMCSSFFAIAQFKPSDIIKTEGGYQMTFAAQGKYRMPLDEKPATPMFEEMDHSSRKFVNYVDLKYIVDITILEDGAKFDVKTEGCDQVPIKIELCLSGNCIVKGSNFIVKGTPGESMIVGDGMIEASVGLDKLQIGPGFMDHYYTSAMRGSVPQSSGDYTVYYTGYTNIDKTITIKAV